MKRPLSILGASTEPYATDWDSMSAQERAEVLMVLPNRLPRGQRSQLRPALGTVLANDEVKDGRLNAADTPS